MGAPKLTQPRRLPIRGEISRFWMLLYAQAQRGCGGATLRAGKGGPCNGGGQLADGPGGIEHGGELLGKGVVPTRRTAVARSNKQKSRLAGGKGVLLVAHGA